MDSSNKNACSQTKEDFLEAEQQAQLANRGFWSEPNVMPWDYRQGDRIPNNNRASNDSDLPVCVQNDCNCSDFANQNEAQWVLNAFSGDPHRLDRDGVTCESLD